MVMPFVSSDWHGRAIHMAPFKRYGVSIFYFASVVTTLVLTLPCFFNCQDSSEQIRSALLKFKLTSIHKAGEKPEFPVQIQSGVWSDVPPKVETLEDVLAQASMPNKTVIITTLNEAWAANNSMIDLFLESFHLGERIEHLLQHVVIVCVDQKAYDRCVQLHPHCFQMKTTGVDFTAEKVFMSHDFVKMMWRRIEFLGEVLQLGYSFVFSDGDVVWFRNPLAVFSETMDFQTSTDEFRGRPFDLRTNRPNSGFMYVRSNKRTIELYRHWYEAGMRSPGKNDQQVITSLLHHQDLFRDLAVKVQFFDTVYFAGFCQVSRDMSKVVTMHSNCCIGLSRKLNDLRLALEDWRFYRNATSHPQHQRNTTHSRQQHLWRVPLECNWH